MIGKMKDNIQALKKRANATDEKSTQLHLGNLKLVEQMSLCETTVVQLK